jgi:hypothetical protein
MVIEGLLERLYSLILHIIRLFLILLESQLSLQKQLLHHSIKNFEVL